jgi:hypothetical protein
MILISISNVEFGIPEFESRQTPIGHNIMMVTRSKHAATPAAAVAMSGGSCGQKQRQRH